ncbi:MAG: protein kinase domain-containing protein [Myxococcota bacterium]
MSTHPPEAELAELAQGAVDGERRERLEAHLEACTECRGLVASLLKALNPEVEPGPHRGQVLGRFVVLEPIGAGAIGEVFSAWDSVLERAVALKWLYPSLLGAEGSQLRERLLSEARALAKVQHPNVVSVFDVVEWGRSHVIVMELVPHAKTLRHAAQGREWREVTRFYVEAARGLLAAHAAGVVHGDFKPDNVLLGEGRVRVCDFGLSRALDAVLPPGSPADRRSTSVSGTPAYLPPERFTGASASAQTDAFALCVSLWESLAGRHPFEARELPARLEEMKKGPPPLPVAKQVPAPLEAVLRRGLSFETSARFPSLEALLAALEATLAPRRASQALAVLGVGAALVLGTTGFAGYQYRTQCDDAAVPVATAWSSARRDAVAAAFGKTGHPAAADLARAATAVLDGLASQLGQTRHEACVATAFRGDSDTLLTARNVCVARRLADLDALARTLEAADAKTVERSVLAAETLAQAPGCLDAAALGQVTPPPRAKQQEVDAATRRVADVRALRLTGHVKESLAAAPAAVEAAEAADWKPVLADAETEWANGLERQGKFDEARPRYHRAFTLSLAANDFALAFAAAVQLGFLEGYDAGKLEAGHAWLVVAQGLIAPGRLTGTTEALRAENAEAALLGKQGHFAEAVERYQRVAKALGETPSLNLARLQSNLGSALREAGKAEEGLAWLERSAKMMEAVVGPLHPDLAAAANNLGSALSDLGRFTDAKPWFEKSLLIRERHFGAEGLPLASTLYNLGELALRTGDAATALKQYGRSRAIVEKAKGPEDDDAWDARLGEGLALQALGRHDEALALLERVLPALVSHQFPAWNLAEAKLGIATSLRALGREPQRVRSLAAEVLTLEGPRHDRQRARAKTLL